MIALIAFLTYAAAFSIGIAAWRTNRRFGHWHHTLYFLSCVTAIAAMVYHQLWVLVCPLPILAMMPFTRKGSAAHRMAGMIGMAVWLVVAAIGIVHYRILF